MIKSSSTFQKLIEHKASHQKMKTQMQYMSETFFRAEMSKGIVESLSSGTNWVNTVVLGLAFQISLFTLREGWAMKCEGAALTYIKTFP